MLSGISPVKSVELCICKPLQYCSYSTVSTHSGDQKRDPLTQVWLPRIIEKWLALQIHFTCIHKCQVDFMRSWASLKLFCGKRSWFKIRCKERVWIHIESILNLQEWPGVQFCINRKKQTNKQTKHNFCAKSSSLKLYQWNSCFSTRSFKNKRKEDMLIWSKG